MRRHGDLNLVVHVEPLGMVIHLVSDESDSSHKSKCFVEVFKQEFLVDCVATFNETPTGSEKRLQQFSSFLFIQLCLKTTKKINKT